MATQLEEVLSTSARAALERTRAMPLSYGHKLYECPGSTSERPRVLVVLGEAHVKMGEAAVLGREIVAGFDLRGVETFQAKNVTWGRLLGALIQGPRSLLRFFSLGVVEGSTIVEAKALRFGHTVELERTKTIPFPLHVASVYMSLFFLVSFAHLAYMLVAAFLPGGEPVSALTVIAMLFQAHMALIVPAWFLRAHSWAWVIHPAIAIVSVRDVLMADGTARMMAEHPEAKSAVVVMGRAHLPGYGRELEKRGFRAL